MWKVNSHCKCTSSFFPFLKIFFFSDRILCEISFFSIWSWSATWCKSHFLPLRSLQTSTVFSRDRQRFCLLSETECVKQATAPGQQEALCHWQSGWSPRCKAVVYNDWFFSSFNFFENIAALCYFKAITIFSRTSMFISIGIYFCSLLSGPWKPILYSSSNILESQAWKDGHQGGAA